MRNISYVYLAICVLMTGVHCIEIAPDILHLQNILATDGSYSYSATLANRLQLIKRNNEQLAWRHLWNYLSLLLLGLETMNPSSFNTVRFNSQLYMTMERLRITYSAFVIDTYDYQIDCQMLMMVHRHLEKLLLPKVESPEWQVIAEHKNWIDEPLKLRIPGCFPTLNMFRSLFDAWNTPVSIIQLIVRSYLPQIYLLHILHDPVHVADTHLFIQLYSPLHGLWPERQKFHFEIGGATLYETLLTIVDSPMFLDND